MSKKRNKSNKSSQSQTDKMDAKKAAVLDSGSRNKTPLIAGAVIVAVLIGGGVFLLGGKKGGVSATNAAPTKSASGVQATSKEVSFPVSIFADGKARYFKYDAPNGIQVRYFIMKSSDGVIRAAFDSCDVCWAANKGYRQEGDVMVCNNCGQRFPSVKINEVKGGCNPAPLNRKVDGDRVIIKISDILEGGSRYFNFS